METILNEAASKIDGLAEKVRSAQQSNADLELKMKQQKQDHQDELSHVKTRQEKDLVRMKEKISDLEIKNVELLEKNKRVADNEKQSKQVIEELRIKVDEFSLQ